LTHRSFGCIIKTYSKESEMKIVVKVPKQVRAHIVLFCKDTPFKQKVVQSKIKYKRQPKHKGKHND